MSANAEIIAELRRVLNERDEAREQLDLTKRELGRWVDRETKAVRERDEAREERDLARERFENAVQSATRYAVERDEARAEVERLRETKDYLRTWLSSEELEGLRVKAAEHPLLWEEIHHLKAEVERLREMAHDFEAMREACAEAIGSDMTTGLLKTANIAQVQRIIANMPIPEEP